MRKSIDYCTFIIEVTAVSDLDRMNPKDRAPDGSCLVDGAYRITLVGDLDAGRLTEKALDIFHEAVPISGLEHFDILIRNQTDSDEGDGWLRADLGRYEVSKEARLCRETL